LVVLLLERNWLENAVGGSWAGNMVAKKKKEKKKKREKGKMTGR
jgi:hypothetical protein